MSPVNKDIQVGDWVSVSAHAWSKHKLGTHAARPHKGLSREEGMFALDIGRYPKTVSSDHVKAAPDPLEDPWKLIQNLGGPQALIVPEGHQHTGKECVWEAFVGHEVSDNDPLRLWTRRSGCHPDEDTLELASRFDLRNVHQFLRRVGLWVEEAVAVVDLLS